MTTEHDSQPSAFPPPDGDGAGASATPAAARASRARSADAAGRDAGDKRGRRRRLLLEYVVIAVVAVLVAVLVQAYVVKPYRIPSESMETTLVPGDRVFVNRFLYHFTDVDRGDVVVFKAPETDVVLIKRAIGLPGDLITLRDGAVLINGRVLSEPYLRRLGGQTVPTEPFANGRPWSLSEGYEVPAGHYYMMGDNRIDSGDSREFGPVAEGRIIGEAFFIYWPVSRIGGL